MTEPARRIFPLRPHDFRHTFAYRLVAQMGKDAYEVERGLGYGLQRYIQRYTNLARGCGRKVHNGILEWYQPKAETDMPAYVRFDDAPFVGGEGG